MGRKAAAAGQWGVFAVVVASFLVAGAAAMFFLSDFSGQGLPWDHRAVSEDAVYSSRPAAIRPAVPEASRMLLVAEAPAPKAAPVAAVPAVAKPAVAASAKSWVKHIDGTLTPVSIEGPATQHSNASAGGDSAPAPTGTSAPSSPAASVAAAPTASGPAAPKYVHYGGTTRSDIMGSAAGPVYNFTGSK